MFAWLCSLWLMESVCESLSSVPGAWSLISLCNKIGKKKIPENSITNDIFGPLRDGIWRKISPQNVYILISTVLKMLTHMAKGPLEL